MSTDTKEETQLSRVEIEDRFRKVCEAIMNYGCKEAIGRGSSVPHTPGQEARYAVVTEIERHYSINYASSVRNAEEIAAHEVTEGYAPVAVFDLYQLEGELQLPLEVEWEGTEWMVHGLDYSMGEPTGKWVLKRSSADKRRRSYDWEIVDPDDIKDLYEQWQDDRLPVRYNLAKMQVIVAFNTVPTN